MSGNGLSVMMEVFEKESERLHNIDKAMKEVRQHEALVGIPEEADGTHSPSEDGATPVTLAELLYIHSHGSPVNNIPPRDVLEPSMESHRDEMAEQMKAVLRQAVEGNLEGAVRELEKAGIVGAKNAQNWFTDPANGWAKNADITVEGGWMKNKKTGKPFYVKGKGSDRPLIDTGELRKAITSVVRRKGKTIP